MIMPIMSLHDMCYKDCDDAARAREWDAYMFAKGPRQYVRLVIPPTQ